MKHCLNKRIRNYEISQTDEQEILPPKLHKKRKEQKSKFPSYADAWRNQNVNEELIKCVERQDQDNHRKAVNPGIRLTISDMLALTIRVEKRNGDVK